MQNSVASSGPRRPAELHGGTRFLTQNRLQMPTPTICERTIAVGGLVDTLLLPDIRRAFALGRCLASQTDAVPVQSVRSVAPHRRKKSARLVCHSCPLARPLRGSVRPILWQSNLHLSRSGWQSLAPGQMVSLCRNLHARVEFCALPPARRSPTRRATRIAQLCRHIPGLRHFRVSAAKAGDFQSAGS